MGRGETAIAWHQRLVSRGGSAGSAGIDRWYTRLAGSLQTTTPLPLLRLAMSEFRVIIPARYASTRLPGKPLLDIGGKPMIQRVYEQACKSGAVEVIVATDDARIEMVAREFGASVVMTSSEHESGTDRLQEVVSKLGLADTDIVVNVQGD